MKKLGLIIAVGFGLVSCRQASFIAEDDVYSPSRGYVAASDGSDASYSTYVYSQQGSGTKSAYYNPNDTLQQNQQYTDTRQQGTTVINNYYGNDRIYANGWHGYAAFGYPYNSFHSPWRYGYRSRWVWYGWGYDPFFYGYYSPWNSWCAFGGGWGYGWGHNPYMYGYNPYAWGHGWGYNPYGWGGGWGHNPYAWGGGNTIINGNVYNFYGNQGISAGSGNTVTGSGLIQNGNNFIGKRPTNAAQTTPYSGINKTKSALSADGTPKEVKNISAKRETNTVAQPTALTTGNTVAALPSRNEPRQTASQANLTSQQLTATSKPWTPETVSRPAANTVARPSENQVNTVQPARPSAQQVNRPAVPNTQSVEAKPARPTTQGTVTPGPRGTTPNTETVRPQTNPNNQYNRNNTPQNRQVSPTPAPRQQMSSPQQTRPSGGSFNNSPSRPSGGGSMNTPSRSSGSSGGSISGGGSPRGGGSMGGGSVGGGSRGGRP